MANERGWISVWLLAVLSLALLTTSAWALALQTDSTAPDVTIYSVNSKGDESLYEYLGDKIGLVFIWEAGCPSCAPGGSAVGDLMNRYLDRGVKGIMVTLDGDRAMSELSLKTMQSPYPYVIAIDEHGEVSSKYKVEEFPTLLILDQQKRIRYIGQQVEFYTKPKLAVTEAEKALKQLVEAREASLQ